MEGTVRGGGIDPWHAIPTCIQVTFPAGMLLFTWLYMEEIDTRASREIAILHREVSTNVGEPARRVC